MKATKVWDSHPRLRPGTGYNVDVTTRMEVAAGRLEVQGRPLMDRKNANG